LIVLVDDVYDPPPIEYWHPVPVILVEAAVSNPVIVTAALVVTVLNGTPVLSVKENAAGVVSGGIVGAPFGPM